ncbi:MAG: DEAD/DEAH box helicase family protein [Candidatus Poribacteria bacterium]|nr:DEAD/DEAH box helicase family protein [Candidatus Poribacteria bacterium]
MKEKTNNLTLRTIPDIQPLYILPKEPLTKKVLIPCFQSAAHVDCMMGFFSSEILASLAPGLATFINASEGSLRLVISPILSPEDQAAIKEGLISPEEIANDVLTDIIFTEDFVAQYTLKCLSWMLRHGRLEIRIALMKNALFHPKVWLFTEHDDVIAAHGSSNMTYAGIQKNIEQISISKSWEDAHQQYTAEKFCDQFKQLWSNEDESCTVISMPQAIKENLLKSYRSDIPPTETDLHTLNEKATNSVEESDGTYDIDRLSRPSFAIPSYLQFEEGPFEHQGRAVKAWCEAGYQGVLEMATGSGKTITAMICAHRLYKEQKPLLVVVAAPYIPLIQQWCDEIVPFGLKPVNLTEVNGANERSHEINHIRRRIRSGITNIAVVVVTHRTLCNDEFKTELKKFDCKTLLIGDEVHNLGSEGFISTPPTFFDYRLGLSATPVRQYDEYGTDELFSFFGPIGFQFTLEEAIGRCLVEYEYYVHPVELTDNEMEEWYAITEKIKQNAWRQENDETDEFLTKLLIKRRALLENAENKISKLEEVLISQNLRKLQHTLIYASDKAPQQLEDVNTLLNAHSVLFHQLTHEETANRKKTAQIIQSFQEGTLGILTAKRVLDEGVNIPQIQKAFILASTTVERQWVQRRGRLLRKCSKTSKTHSEIHDFIALPPDLDNIDDTARIMIRSELERVQEFASLAMNAGRSDGSLSLIDHLVKTIYL